VGNNEKKIQEAYQNAREQFGSSGVDTEKAIDCLSRIPISLHCWQGDDVTGFERSSELTGGILATGNYPGKARNADELRADIEKAFSLIPGKHRVNLHAIYAEAPRRVERNELSQEHFSRWIDWAKSHGYGLDFNPTCFSHPKSASGFTLTHSDSSIRNFWIEHCIVCRRIGAFMGQSLGTPCVVNIWIPDGYKDTPADRKSPRDRLRDSLDRILSEKLDRRYILDSVEGKLFGIGTESYVAGSFEFYFGYAVTRKILLCLDTGHFHPTETIADKISSVLQWLDGVLLHISRGIRWDSDHVVVFSDELLAIAQEIVRGEYLPRVKIGLDYFDASINRIAAWVIGMRAVQKALLVALLEPVNLLKEMEYKGDFSGRLALQEHSKNLPYNAVWDYYCLIKGVPPGLSWLEEVRAYERNVLSKRSL
jgi:L-rhamnose isomerase